MGGKLSEGDLNGTVVTCPRHGSRFEVTDGTVVRWLKGTGLLATIGKMIKSPRPIRTYPLKTIWLTQKLMAALFDVTVPTINEHLSNVYRQG